MKGADGDSGMVMMEGTDSNWPQVLIISVGSSPEAVCITFLRVDNVLLWNGVRFWAGF